jgi:hypothetical protein
MLIIGKGGDNYRVNAPQLISLTNLASKKTKACVIDILTRRKTAVIPKPHNLGFCFIATASTPVEALVLCSLHRLSPQALRPYVSKSQKGEFLCTLLILGMFIPIALSSFPGLPICLRRQFHLTSL